MNPRRSKHVTITLRDVARASGFSPATVSIVLNEAPLARYGAALPDTYRRLLSERAPARAAGAP